MNGARLLKRATIMSLTTQANAYIGICEKMRLIYDVVYQMTETELRDKIIEGLVDSMIMAKKMSDRLIYYQQTYQDKTGHKAQNLVKQINSGKIKRFRGLRKPL